MGDGDLLTSAMRDVRKREMRDVKKRENESGRGGLNRSLQRAL